jgi:B12 binding domain
MHLSGFVDPALEELSETGIYLGNTYARIMPASLPRVASVLERHLDAEVGIVDLRIGDAERHEPYKEMLWEGQYSMRVDRVGSRFADCDAAVQSADWVGFTSHFTYESGIIRDLIQHVRRVNPAVRIMVGGADVKARPHDYLRFGADLAFVGDCDPTAISAYDGTPRIVGPYSHPFEELTAPAFGKLDHLPDYVDSHDGPVPGGVSFPIAFLYFTRGCPRECDFCESRRSTFERLDLEHSLEMLNFYHKAGIRTLNFSDDNLLLVAAKEQGRRDLLDLFREMRRLRFAWEFPNGLEVGRLIRGGALDEELMEALFGRSIDPATGQGVGCYRVYVPLETFESRQDYRKLKDIDEQKMILTWLAHSDLAEIDFGIVLPPTSSESTFEATRRGYLDIKEIFHGGPLKARYSLFHLIPISLFRSMPTKYSVSDFPEGWNFYFPVYDGSHFTARELFERRLRLVKEIDGASYSNLKNGQYAYG